MSATNFTSAGQFAGLTIIAGAATFLEMALTQLIINSRYFLMSFALSQKIDPNTPMFHRLILAFGITDEVFGVSVASREVKPFLYLWGDEYCIAWMGAWHAFRCHFWKHLARKTDECFKYCTCTEC